MYVASFTARGGKGIYVFKFHPKTGKIEPAGLAAGRLWQANSDAFSGGLPRMFSQVRAEWPSMTAMVRGVQNPVYIAVHPNGRTLYTADDLTPPTVSALRIDPASGKLTMLSSKGTGGKAPCFLSVDATGKNLLVANVLGPNVVNFPIDADGSLRDYSCVMWHKGIGEEARFEAHPHSVRLSPDNHFALSADMGLDEVLVYRYDAHKGSLTPNDPPFVRLPRGAGARILIFHPNGRFAYVIEEMGSIISILQWDATYGVLTPAGAVSTLPPEFHGTNAAAEIRVHPNGKFLYASNRGHDSIAVFSVDGGSGKLTPLESTSAGGRPPRDIAIDPSGNYLFAVNVETQNVVEFRIDPATGRLTRTNGDIHVEYPTAVAFAPAQ